AAARRDGRPRPASNVARSHRHRRPPPRWRSESPRRRASNLHTAAAAVAKRGDGMAHPHFAPCPPGGAPLPSLVGGGGSTLTPGRPRCKEVVPVSHATFLMADNSRPSDKPFREVPPRA